MDVLNFLLDDDKKHYKCFDTLKEITQKNKSFRDKLTEGYISAKVEGFSEYIWEMIGSQNIRRVNSFTDVFVDGANIGYCTVASRQLSYSFNNCYICGGVVPFLAGTENCDDGSHTWIVFNGKVYDTTLMLVIDEEFAKNSLGYIEQNRYNPSTDTVYLAAKAFTLDSSLSESKRK